jgi:ectoine hydroxylase-related dioxygenase (phytanoyl-CoA dioxygenase family)
VKNILQGLWKRGGTAPSGPLGEDGRLASDLWVDQPGAAERIAAWRRKGEIGEGEAAALAHFVDDGYLTFDGGFPAALFDDFAADVDRAWRERPPDLAWAREGLLRSFAYADEGRDRRASYRIADFHSHSRAARALFLWRPIFDYVERILGEKAGEKAVATQSLYFEYGSQQALHRDPIFVQMKPPSHLVAAWIALEDIHPDSGPLVYVPGSHRLPYYEFSPGEHRFDVTRHGAAESEAMAAFDREQVRAAGLRTEALTCRRGEVLLWHASLLHGGSVVADPARTRRSFVVHFSTLADYRLRNQNLIEQVVGEDGRPAERTRIFETETVLEADGCHGFDSPIRDYRPPPR